MADQSLSEDLVAGSISDRGAKRGDVGERIKVILRGTTEDHGEDSFANEYADVVANASRVTGVEGVLYDRVDQARAILGITERDPPALEVRR